ncbi:hypothetical protein Salat_1850000 [Sesamum alatum]|uniref:Uncharacterized protein n=1 Tax=Sesamum alatum TaxID=300844 RepID=A0AAE2CHV1_9LAMI|nr:hypothetical protein Salat_1850000 [Sesamum alatum]
MLNYQFNRGSRGGNMWVYGLSSCGGWVLVRDGSCIVKYICTSVCGISFMAAGMVSEIRHWAWIGNCDSSRSKNTRCSSSEPRPKGERLLLLIKTGFILALAVFHDMS